MAHPTPPLSGEDLLLDDEDVILLTDEIPPKKKHDAIEICQLADPSEPREVPALSDTLKERSVIIDFGDAIEPSDFKAGFPPDFSVSEEDILNFNLEDTQTPDIFPEELDTATSITLSASDITLIPESEYPADDLQRLIDEVVHDSQPLPRDSSGILPDKPEEYPIVNDGLPSLSQDQIDASVERVIRNLFAERIENILNEVITTAVNREIENLRTTLLDYLTSVEPVNKAKS